MGGDPQWHAEIRLDVISLVKQLHMTDDKKHYMQSNLYRINRNAASSMQKREGGVI